jgi:hypothetical protein
MELRGFDRAALERILATSSERYFDVETGRSLVIGRHDNQLVAIPYEIVGDAIVPVTVHATSRQQINFRLQTGRFTHEPSTSDLF